MGDLSDDAEDRRVRIDIDRMMDRMEGGRRRRPILPMELAVAAMSAEQGVDRFGSEPPVGTVLRWTATGTYGRGSGRVLTYLALRTPNGWWDTRDNSHGSTPWAGIVRLIGDNPCDVATRWTEIPAPAPGPSGDDAVGAWASQFLPDSTGGYSDDEPVDLDGSDEGDR